MLQVQRFTIIILEGNRRPSVILQELPHEYIPPSMLKKVVMHGDTNKLYATEIRRSDQIERRVGGGFDRDEYEEFPDRYISTFSH